MQFFHLFIEFSGFLEHSCRSKVAGNFFKHILWVAHISVINNISSTCGNTSLQIQLNRSDIIPFLFFNLCSLFLLPGLKQPRVIVTLQFLNLAMMRLLGHFDSLLPFMHLLVHLHGLLDLIILQIDRLSSVELFL